MQAGQHAQAVDGLLLSIDPGKPRKISYWDSLSSLSTHETPLFRFCHTAAADYASNTDPSTLPSPVPGSVIARRKAAQLNHPAIDALILAKCEVLSIPKTCPVS